MTKDDDFLIPSFLLLGSPSISVDTTTSKEVKISFFMLICIINLMHALVEDENSADGEDDSDDDNWSRL